MTEQRIQLIDLQVHTRASDGAWTLEEVLRDAERKKITHLAITDHDTTAAWSADALRTALLALGPSELRRPLVDGAAATDEFLSGGVRVIQGEEVTCNYRGSEIHVLAYFLDETTVTGSRLDMHNRRMEHANQERARSMVDRLQKRGYRISYERIRAAGGSPNALTREFIAKQLMERNEERLRKALAALTGSGNVTVDAVRNVILARNREFYASVEPFYRLAEEPTAAPFPELEQAVEMILECSAVPVLSHPGRYGFLAENAPQGKAEKHGTQIIPKVRRVTAEQLVEDLIACSDGLAGIEVFNRRHNQSQVQFWQELALRYDMLYTAGTDFHGETNNFLGIAPSEDVIQRLYDVRRQVRQWRQRKL